MLGISLGCWRATVIAIVGWLGGVLCTALIVDPHETLRVVVPMTLFFGVIVAMPAAIVRDLITRSTRVRPRPRLRRKLLHPIRTTKNTFAPIGRMRELVRDARHHNLVHVRYRSETTATQWAHPTRSSSGSSYARCRRSGRRWRRSAVSCAPDA